jgi:hypothetical protein
MVVLALLAALLAVGVWWLGRHQRARNAAAQAEQAKAQRATRTSRTGRAGRWAGKTIAGGDVSDKALAGMSESQLSLMEMLLRMRLGQTAKLTREQVEAWLAMEGRSAANLLAASRLLDDPALLEEAARKFPKDARVQMDVLLKGLFPGERQQWVEAFKRSAPASALPNVLAAQQYFKNGLPEQAAQELLMAAKKPGMDTYLFDIQPSLQSAWTSSGYSQAAGQLMSTFGTQGPVISALQDVAAQSANWAAQLRQGGDTASADAMVAAGFAMGQQFTENGRTFIAELVGMQIEGRFLQQMSPDAPAAGGSQTAGARLADLQQQQQALVALAQSFDDTTPLRVTDADIGGYFERLRRDGEFSAMQWLRGLLEQP